VRVRVPATSANLGPGFDALGLALGWHDELTAELTDIGLEVRPYGNVPVDERNLVVRSMRTAFSVTGDQPPGLRLTYTSAIPHSRGLGSSSAAICAGVVAALALRGVTPDDPLALELAARIEGHPDNVAPCLSGGATVAWYTEGRARATRFEPAAGIVPVVFVPTVRTSTEAARAALPDAVAHADAAYTAGRAALLVTALTERPDLLFDATEDRLHQPYRLAAAPLSAQLVSALRSAGVPAVLSGSGPSVLALCRDEAEAERAGRITEVVPPDSRPSVSVSVHRPGIDRTGAVLLAP
jgi:homoserine kinase